MATAQLKQELDGSIGTVADRCPKTAFPSSSARNGMEYVIETDLTDEEHALIDDSARRYRDNPSGFVSLTEALRRLGYAV
jgi:malate/lactate dehydrogenase